MEEARKMGKEDMIRKMVLENLKAVCTSRCQERAVGLMFSCVRRPSYLLPCMEVGWIGKMMSAEKGMRRLDRGIQNTG